MPHPNIKLFITQGGLQSMEETIYNEVPCVVIPFFAEQEQNAKLMANKGFAKTVDGKPFFKERGIQKCYPRSYKKSKVI
ncbi:hypothetical protein NQ314_008480 [Rhamnusium bicolor]|uniref:Uncharacterized protein n=1 Tax=Rhamnusium bicolor TaxID=1586634 RepID=A0AAV8Y9A8_9CUCU|nr:hypothetical protein NQ314_008480 [Rhamnusium bicolor]